MKEEKERPVLRVNGAEIECCRVQEGFGQMEELKALYNASFPDCERKPFEMILSGAAQKKMDAFAFVHKGKVAALAFVILSRSCVVLDYLAVDPSLHSRGLGSAILQMLDAWYRRPLIVEIESTCGCAPQSEPVRRKAFYLRNGLLDTGISILLFGVEMELLSTRRPVGYEEYEAVMQQYFGRMMDRYLHRLEDRTPVQKAAGQKDSLVFEEDPIQ